MEGDVGFLFLLYGAVWLSGVRALFESFQVDSVTLGATGILLIYDMLLCIVLLHSCIAA